MPTNSTSRYGPKVNSEQARDFLLRLFTGPASAVPPICLWGKHGIGKTELIRDLATQQTWPLVSISPAQFEEMGDLLGLPFLDQGSGDHYPQTRFAPPEWVPQIAGPGILLVDDFNRADDRILRGLMALWQERKLSSWALPDDWYIVLTANPEGDIYSVTPVDEANLTRMLHLQLEFDVKSWVNWAREQELAEEGIAFVLKYPETINGQQTTPRTLAYFLRLWEQYGKPNPEDAQLQILAESALAQETAHQFIRFLRNQDYALPDPATLLAQSTAQTSALLENLQQANSPRNDLISQLCSSLLQYLAKQVPLNKEQAQQLLAFLLNENLPAEQVLLVLHGLSERQHPVLPQLLAVPQLGQLMLGD